MPTYNYTRTRLGDNTTAYNGDGHTVAAVKVVSFSRSQTPTAQKATIKVTHGDVDVNGAPFPQNLIVEVSIRRPLNIDDASWDIAIAETIRILSDNSIATDLKAGRLPDADSFVITTL